MGLDKSYIAPFDYELALYDDKYSFLKSRYRSVRKEFEYLLWFVERGIVLYQEGQYPSSYKRFVESLDIEMAFSTDLNKAQRWKGLLTDIPQERMLNSRQLTLELLLKSGETYCIDSLSETGSWLIKYNTSFSGRGVKIVEGPRPIAAKGFVVEPLHDRLLDIGVWVEPGEENLYTVNLINKDFSYKGSLRPSKTSVGEYGDGVEIIDQHKKILDSIINSYRNRGAQRGFGLDCYYYSVDKKSFFRPLVEFNYRPTMGYMLHQLNKYWSTPHHETALFIIPNRTFFSDYDWSKKQGVICLSPPKNRFSLLYVSVSELAHIRSILMNLHLSGHIVNFDNALASFSRIACEA